MKPADISVTARERDGYIAEKSQAWIIFCIFYKKPLLYIWQKAYQQLNMV